MPSALVSLALLAGSAFAQQQNLWGQCGGIGYGGPTNCVAGSCCSTQNPCSSTNSGPPIPAGSLQQVNSFGSNPSNIQMFIYVPNKLVNNPAIIVALHPCGGSAQQWYSGTQLPSYAEQKGFIIIYPQTTAYTNCWDVNNVGSLTHNGSGDAAGVISMINFTLNKFSGNRNKVFVMGASSGGMMTNVMVGSYPEYFEAGASYSGVPFACLYGSTTPPSPSGSNQTCAQGLTHTPQEWANFVYNAYPGYTGKRPRMQIAHGLDDGLVRPVNGWEQLKQWGAVLGLTNTYNVTGASVPEGSEYIQVVYGDGSKLVGYMGQGVGHWAPVKEQVMLKFFGLL
ncbi:Alpha/Beta hydrolase protein [Staphylotrichum tortipilum]|uniref:Carboxylic ester hydrolase n=1 Tax=Staphylotrichum tortipilum TaxID=2831512 RepID=A0AAN6MJI2_9PEZI|nr:Alpha/Beta hydrolase protein [Staphylotrichum longicolle]